jgi:anti-anti-sigma regulatory factor
MNFDFEQNEKEGILLLSGKLTKVDTDKLRVILLNSIKNSIQLTINLDGITTISPSCLRTFYSVFETANESEKEIIFTGEKNKETSELFDLNKKSRFRQIKNIQQPNRVTE